MGDLKRFVHTVSLLKKEQVLYRAFFILKRFMPALGKCLQTYRECPSSVPLKPVSHFARYQHIDGSDIASTTFDFLNEPKCFDGKVDWHVPERGRLWRYNLHYFQYLFPKQSLSGLVGQELMLDWVRDCPPVVPDAWDPFPLSLRTVNWIKFLIETGVERQASKKIKDSLFAQLMCLEKRLEFHLMGNHLFKNAKALVFGGLFFKGSQAQHWLGKGLKLIGRELDEQILADGGHFERSPMYHSMILEDCLDLLNLFKAAGRQETDVFIPSLEHASARMTAWLACMNHPDGRIALFNDAAFGIELMLDDLVDYFFRVTGRQPGEPTGRAWSLEDSGYYVLAPRSGDRLLIDCGRIGPDYQPGHAHCDTLSFELSLGERRVIVDSGCCQYEASEIRSYNRGNIGHNTVTVDGQNQSEVWGAHRVAQRASPLYASLEDLGNELVFEGAHDGYERIPGRPMHQRRVSWNGSVIRITDQIKGKGEHNLESRLHVHPDLEVAICGNEAFINDEGIPLAKITSHDPDELECISGWYCPEFGLQLQCSVLRIRKKANLPTSCGWIIRKTDGE